MELRWSMCVLFAAAALVSQCSVSGHTMHKRADDEDGFLDDEADWPQNDEFPQNDDFPQNGDVTQNDETGDGDDSDVDGKIISKPMNFNVSMGTNVSMECQVEPNEGPVVQWFKNGDAIFLGSIKLGSKKNIPDRYKLDNNRTLVVESARPSDAGEYKCQVMVSDDASESSVTHRLVVQAPPNITHFSATNQGRVVEGTDLELRCDVTGVPTPQIMWSRQKEAKGPNVRLVEQDAIFTSNSAIIKNAKPENSGIYYCYALNTEGNAQREIRVTVFAKPHADVHRQVVNAAVGAHALLQCSARGDPAPTITWYKDNMPIIPDDKRFFITFEGSHSNLTVIPAEEKDFGTYTCVAQNVHNKHSKSAELVQRPVLEDVDVDGGLLSWTLHSHLRLQRIEIQLVDEMENNRTIIEIPVPDTQDKVYELKYQVSQSVAPGKYKAYIKAKNEKDWNREQSPIFIDVGKQTEEQPMYIQRSSVYRGSAHSVSLSSSCLVSTTLIYLLVRTL